MLFQAQQDEKQQVRGNSLAVAGAWSHRPIALAKLASAECGGMQLLFVLKALSKF